MTEIRRFGFATRIHMAVVHNGTVYLTGQVGTPGKSAGEQMREVLSKVDALLHEAGTYKSKILHSTLWLDDMRDYAAVNEEWDAWVDKANAPSRSTGESRMARPGMLVELSIIAAV